MKIALPMATLPPWAATMPEPGARESVRAGLLAALGASEGPLTTAELRIRLDSGAAVVNEVIYRNLVVLERRGAVVRLPRCGRHTSWTVGR